MYHKTADTLDSVLSLGYRYVPGGPPVGRLWPNGAVLMAPGHGLAILVQQDPVRSTR